MKFSFVTLFPNLIEPYFFDSILKKAINKNIISYDFFNPRDYTTNKHKKVDDTLCGGGAGQLLFVQPLIDILTTIKNQNQNAHIIFPLAAAKPFRQTDAIRLTQKDHIVFVSGRYEGIDERVIEKFANEVFSIGEYILTGGELPSLIMTDAISRNIPDVLGNKASLENESYNLDINSTQILLEAPSFTKPTTYQNQNVPNIYLSGNHNKIAQYKKQLSICKTKYYQPKLLF
jgi:tRNA (guanine37-N1)-methyltransferase